MTVTVRKPLKPLDSGTFCWNLFILNIPNLTWNSFIDFELFFNILFKAETNYLQIFRPPRFVQQLLIKKFE